MVKAQDDPNTHVYETIANVLKAQPCPNPSPAAPYSKPHPATSQPIHHPAVSQPQPCPAAPLPKPHPAAPPPTPRPVASPPKPMYANIECGPCPTVVTSTAGEQALSEGATKHLYYNLSIKE